MSSLSPSYRARKRRKQDLSGNGTVTASTKSSREPSSRASAPAYPLQAFLWPARGGVSQWITLPLILMFVGLYRWTAGFWGYSGFQSPPMHGDFEAQRHWMEITTQLPITQWYFYDLEWWGLDYPPLTAYHSWLLGKIGAAFNPQWFALHTSRGLDDPILKVYMRATVLISEYLIYIPAVVIFCRSVARTQRSSSWETSVALTAILMQPATILIDHAHFQYNTVMLGFVIASVTCLLSSPQPRFAWSCIFFVCALCFKQMALYYAPAIFAYLLGSCIFPRIHISRFLIISITTSLSFVAIFTPFLLAGLHEGYNGTFDPTHPRPPLLDRLPFNISQTSPLYPPLLQLTQSIHRIFPLARGLFEDKVANFWCALHTVRKLHRYPPLILQLASLALTLASIAPPCILLFLYPRGSLLLPALATTSLGFFLFSFQVHEKSILLPLLPITLMLASHEVTSSEKDGGRAQTGLDPQSRRWVTFANLLGCWTLFPLLKRDQLRVPYWVLTLLWGWLVGVPGLVLGSSSDGSAADASSNTRAETGASDGTSVGRKGRGKESWFSTCTRVLHGTFYTAMLAWHALEAFVQPPQGKPDLWVVMNACVGAAGFGVCYVWCLWVLWERVKGMDGEDEDAGEGGRKGKVKRR